MFFRAIAFLVGFIAVIAGLRNYDSTLATASLPIITGGLVMLIAVFNLLPRLKRCPNCNKRLTAKMKICRFCGSKQPPLDS